MPLHGKASESLSSLLETFRIAHATKKPVVHDPLSSATATVTPHADGVTIVEREPTDSPPLHETEIVVGSYSSDSSSTTVEAPEHDPDRSDVFGHIGPTTTYRPKERVTSVSSEMSVVSNTTVIWVGSLTPAPGQPGPSRMDMQARRPPSEITVDWRDVVADEQEEGLSALGDVSPLSISPGSPKTMHVKTPGQSGMPSPNVEIYSTANTPVQTDLDQFHPTQEPVEGKKLETIPDVPEKQEEQVSNEGGKQGRPVVPFFYGSKIPVVAGKLSTTVGNKNTYGSLIAHQRRTSGNDVPSTNPWPSTPKPHSCAATPLAAPKPRGLERSLTMPVRVLTRKDTIAGHFPGTPPKSAGTTTPTSGGIPRSKSSSTSGGSPRPRSSSKIPIPTSNPTTPVSTATAEGRKLNDIPPFGGGFLGDIAEADCESEAIWERRRDDVMGPLGVSPTTRLGGVVRPASLARISRAATMPMGSLVGAAMTSNGVTRS